MLDPGPMPSEDRRRAIFAALVEAQDRTRSLHEAKQQVLARFDPADDLPCAAPSKLRTAPRDWEERTFRPPEGDRRCS
jgi:hypothetical protein